MVIAMGHFYSDNYKNVSVCKSEICQLEITEPMEVYF